MSEKTKMTLGQLEELAQQLSRDEAVINMYEYGRDIQLNIADSVKAMFSPELAICRALVASSAWLALALYSNRSDKRLFPHNWLQEGSLANPDVMIGCMLCQLTNFGYAVIELVTKGLDTPARALVRSTADLSYTLAVVVSDREIFQAYALNEELSAKDLWYKLFSGRKINKHMAKIDASFDLPKEWTEFFREFREENGEFFSEAVHHSPTAIFIGAQPTIPGTDKVELAVLGGAPSASKATLNYLATSLNYGLTTFIKCCEQNNNFKKEFTEPKFWESGYGLHHRMQPIFLQWLSQSEANKSIQPTANASAD